MLPTQLCKLADRALGAGANGSVFAAIDFATGRSYAVKEIAVDAGELAQVSGAAPSPASEERGDNDRVRSVMRELAISAAIPPHRNVVRYFGCRVAAPAGHESPTTSIAALDSPLTSTTAKVLDVVMELVPGGTVASVVRASGDGIPEALARRWMRDVVAGLDHLHNVAGVVHRDLSSNNLLLDARGGVKIGDYGTARWRWASKPAAHGGGQGASVVFTTCLGTASFIAPEVAAGSSYGAPADVWSAACVAVEMLTGHAPTYGLPRTANGFAIMFAVSSDDSAVPALPPPGEREARGAVEFSDAARDFVRRCGARDAAARPTARQLLQHAWIAAADDVDAPASDDDTDEAARRSASRSPTTATATTTQELPATVTMLTVPGAEHAGAGLMLPSGAFIDVL
jgi:serine/threonine protein kinase